MLLSDTCKKIFEIVVMWFILLESRIDFSVHMYNKPIILAILVYIFATSVCHLEYITTTRHLEIEKLCYFFSTFASDHQFAI